MVVSGPLLLLLPLRLLGPLAASLPSLSSLNASWTPPCPCQQIKTIIIKYKLPSTARACLPADHRPQRVPGEHHRRREQAQGHHHEQRAGGRRRGDQCERGGWGLGGPVRVRVCVCCRARRCVCGVLGALCCRALTAGAAPPGPVLQAHVPLNEMFGYSTGLRSMTQVRPWRPCCAMLCLAVLCCAAGWLLLRSTPGCGSWGGTCCAAQ